MTFYQIDSSDLPIKARFATVVPEFTDADTGETLAGEEYAVELPDAIEEWDQLVAACEEQGWLRGAVHEVVSDDQTRRIVRFDRNGWSA